MNVKTIVPLVIALVLGLLAAKVGRDMLMKNKQGGTPNAKMTKLVVVKGDVAPGSVLAETDLALRDFPTEGTSAYAFSSVSEVVGRVVTTQLVKNQAVLDTLLAPRGALGGAQAMVPDGKRAVTMEVNEFSGVGGLLSPGCHVDVVQTIHVKGDEGGLMAKTIVENLTVIAVGRRMSAMVPGAAAGQPGAPEPEMFRSVTVLATAEQAEAIDLASHVGRPRLVLRNVLDAKATGSKGVSVAELRTGQRDPEPSDDKFKEMMARLLGNKDPIKDPTTKPAVEAPKVEARDPKYREVEVIRGGTSTNVRMSLNDNGSSFTGGAEKLEPAVPAER
jgi:pilus assembly protein CpaB